MTYRCPRCMQPFRMLFTGDAGAQTEARMLIQGATCALTSHALPLNLKSRDRNLNIRERPLCFSNRQIAMPKQPQPRRRHRASLQTVRGSRARSSVERKTRARRRVQPMFATRPEASCVIAICPGPRAPLILARHRCNDGRAPTHA